jgi:hypothetical protein
MTIRVPLRLRREPRGWAAGALYLPGRQPSELLAVCAALALDPWGRVFAADGGFLLVLEQAATGAVPGAIRLRKLTEGLYLPADAVLVPPLLEDEATGVVRDKGLVFLHGGRVLEFDREAAIDPAELLQAAVRARRPWRSLPELPEQAERITQVVLDVPDENPDEIYREIRKQLNRPGPQSASSQQDERGGQTAGAGQGAIGDLAGEETQAGTGKTAEPGSGSESGGGRGGKRKSLREAATQGFLLPLAGLGGAISAMREKIQWEWVDHSSLIKKLVREFREGDKSLALKRAIPIMRPGEGHAPWIAVRANWLPWSRAVYNLADLLRRPSRPAAPPAPPRPDTGADGPR